MFAIGNRYWLRGLKKPVHQIAFSIGLLKIRFILTARWIISRYSSRCFDSLEPSSAKVDFTNRDNLFPRGAIWWLQNWARLLPQVWSALFVVSTKRSCCSCFFLTMMRYICFTGGWLRNQSMQPARMEEQVHKGPSVRKKFCNSRKRRCKIGSCARNFSRNTFYAM